MSSEDDVRVQKVTKSVVANAMQAIASLTAIPDDKLTRDWLIDRPPFPATMAFPMHNGILDLGSGQIHPPTPKLFALSASPVKYDQEGICPTWLRFLSTLWPEDAESIDTLGEWFGLNITVNTSFQKMLLIIGPPRSGKGTIARVLVDLLGTDAVASPTLHSLTGPFGLWPLLGRPTAIIPDARLSARTDAVAVVERLLSIVGEDPQDVHRKNQPTLNSIRLPTRFTMLTNELPHIPDSSGALLARTIVLRLRESFVGREDYQLAKKLHAELPGILNWSIEGLHRLMARGRFIQPESGASHIDELATMASPVNAFVNECCKVGPDYTVATTDLYEAWKAWAVEHGRPATWSIDVFGRNLRSALPGLEVVRPRCDSKRVRHYQGIAISESWSNRSG